MGTGAPAPAELKPAPRQLPPATLVRVTAIRPATPSDVDALRSLAVAAYERYIPRIGRPPAPMVADYDRAVADGHVWVAEDGGAIVGLIVLVLEPDQLLIENVAVAPARHGQGLGTRLLAFADQVAREHGRGRVRLYTHETMTENIAFYPRRGYVETHRETEQGRRRVFFSKDLSGDG